MRGSLGGRGVNVDDLASQVDSKFMSTFIRVVKPAIVRTQPASPCGSREG